MNYLVKNIRINNNEPFEMVLPVDIIEDGYLAKLYLRTYLFDYLSILFETEHYPPVKENADSSIIVQHHTQLETIQPTNSCLLDSFMIEYERTKSDGLTVSCLPMYADKFVVNISGQELADCDGVLTIAAYQKLAEYLPIDFIYGQLPRYK